MAEIYRKTDFMTYKIEHTPACLMKCEKCKEDTYCIYVTKEGDKVCGKCHDKLHGVKNAKSDRKRRKS